jgi:hypothetical protein
MIVAFAGLLLIIGIHYSCCIRTEISALSHFYHIILQICFEKTIAKIKKKHCKMEISDQIRQPVSIPF